MITQKMQNAINGQIQAEIHSAYLYLGMSTYCESKNLSGFAKWLRLQNQEETTHATKLIDYLLERGGTVSFKAIDAPPAEFGTPLEVFETVMAHEQHVTSLINKLYEVALAEKDFASQIFLQWFINEQVEEEASVSSVVERLKMVGEKSGGLLYIDKELGKRA
ncbi:MAG TPA: ferritin [Negativicutes bacterium]|jgi:ferritin